MCLGLVRPVKERQRIGHLEMAEPELLNKSLAKRIQCRLIPAAKPVIFCARPPPPARRAGGRQSDPLFGDRDSFVPKPGSSHERAKRTQILWIIRIECNCSPSLDTHLIGLARHPGRTGGEPAHKGVIRGKLDGMICGSQRVRSQIEALVDALPLVGRQSEAPIPLSVENENERRPSSCISRLIARQTLEAIPRLCDWL